MNELIAMGSERLRFELQLPVLLSVRRPRGRISRQARGLFERRYTAERNYDLLMEIYRDALGQTETGE